MQFGRQVAVVKEPSELVPNVRFGSLADLQDNSSPMSAFERKADVKTAEYLDFPCPLTANTGQSPVEFRGFNQVSQGHDRAAGAQPCRLGI